MALVFILRQRFQQVQKRLRLLCMDLHFNELLDDTNVIVDLAIADMAQSIQTGIEELSDKLIMSHWMD